MIYSLSGTSINSAYEIDSNEIDFAYDLSGATVFERINPYEYYSISQIYNKSRDYSQGMDIYGNYMVIFRDSDHCFLFVNMTTWEIDYTVSTDVNEHGNDISFSKAFYDTEDEFPLLFLNGQRSKGLRIDINNLTATTIKTINATPTGSTWVVYGIAFNDDMTRYYTLGYNTNNYSDSSGFIFLETWDISESLENPTRLDSVIRAWFPCIQGMQYHDGLLWVASGMGDPVKVFALDLSDASIVKTVDLTRTGELEGIGWGYDQDTDKYFCVYGQVYNGITYYRIDFSPIPIS